MIAAADEAGKGALIGPLVISLVFSNKKKELIKELKKEGIRDSKMLSSKRRKEIINKVDSSLFSVYYEIISCQEIDKYVYHNNLNLLLTEKYSNLIDKIKDKVVTVYLDCYESKEDNLKKVFLKLFPNLKIIVKHKADEKFPLVSFASLFSKEKRQELIGNNNREYGSGYPSDLKTRKYILRNYNLYRKKKLKEIRYSWKINYERFL